MKILRYWQVALETLRNHPLRSVLTMLGMIIGVAAVVLTIGLGRGAAQSINQDITKEGANLLTINAGFATENRLTLADAEALANPTLHPETVAVAVSYAAYGERLTYGDHSLDVQVSGATANLAQLNNLALVMGRFLTKADEVSQRRVVVLSQAVAQALFPDQNPLQQRVRLQQEVLQVVGVLAESSSGFTFDGEKQVFIPLSLAQKRLFDVPRYRGAYTVSEIKVQVAAFEQLSRAEYKIERTLRLRHHLQRHDPNDFLITNQARLLALADGIAQTMTLLLGSIGAVSLVVGGIGIMNIMLVSVTERTREIGLRKAIGAQDRDILLQFLTEAVTLTFVGGVLGIAFSCAIALFSQQIPDVPFAVVIEGNVVALALGVSMGCGFVFGLYPAMRATQLDPIEALRYE